VDNAQGPFSVPSGPEERDRGSNQALREALRALASSGAAGMPAGSLSPETLADLAQRAGLAGGAADLARLMGRDAGAAGAALSGPQYVVFAVAGIECCVPAAAVQGLERMGEVTAVPNTAAWVLGVVQQRGSIVSVVDLGAFLGLPATIPSARSRLLVMAHRGMSIGFVVDAVLEMRADSSGMQSAGDAAPPEWLAPYAADVLALGERRIVLVDVQRLLFADAMQQYRSDAV
jgi:purine-binding chemotaxis protein CheW